MMNYKTARQLILKNCKTMSLEQAQKHKVKLIDAWRHSKADYGFEVAVKEGFYIKVVDSGASGYTPRDIWLTHQILARLDEVEAYEKTLLQID